MKRANRTRKTLHQLQIVVVHMATTSETRQTIVSEIGLDWSDVAQAIVTLPRHLWQVVPRPRVCSPARRSRSWSFQRETRRSERAPIAGGHESSRQTRRSARAAPAQARFQAETQLLLPYRRARAFRARVPVFLGVADAPSSRTHSLE